MASSIGQRNNIDLVPVGNRYRKIRTNREHADRAGFGVAIRAPAEDDEHTNDCYSMSAIGHRSVDA